MKALLIVLVVLLFGGAWLGEAIIQDSGYVLIAYQNVSIETSLWVMAALLIIGFALIHWLINLVTHFRSPVSRFKQWRHSRNERKAGSKATDGLKAALSGDWWRARRQLAQAANLSSAPALYLIEAARMAAKDQDEKECSRLLELAQKSEPQLEQAIQQIKAELDLELGHVERARIALEQMVTTAPNNLQNKALLCRALEQQQDWTALAPMIPELRKRNLISEEQARKLRRSYAIARLQEHTSTVEQLNEAWESLSFEAQQESRVKQCYVELLSQLGAIHRAETLLVNWLNKHWDESLLLAYSEIAGADPKAQLQTAKRWHQAHPESGGLELCLARLSRRCELWGAAITHYRKSLELGGSKTAELELGDLYLQLGETDQAATLLAHSSKLIHLPQPNEQDRKSRLEVMG